MSTNRAGRPAPILILGTGWGGGHDKVAEELGRRLNVRGWDVERLDLLDLLPVGLGQVFRLGPTRLSNKWPGLSEAAHTRIFAGSQSWGPVWSGVLGAASRRLNAHVERIRPAGVFSTFDLCALILSEIRLSGASSVPSAALAMDACTNPAWRKGGIDLWLHLHPGTLPEMAGHHPAASTAPCVPASPGPILRSQFGPAASMHRRQERNRLDLATRDRAVLILGGSRGAGDIMEIFGGVADLDGFVPIAVCAENERLYTRLRQMVTRAGRPGVVLGWVDDMAALMSSADVVVDSVGGVGCCEAMACGLPVICHLPPPGRRKTNVMALAQAGLVDYVVESGALPARLEELSKPGLARTALVEAGRSIFVADATDQIESLIRA